MMTPAEAPSTIDAFLKQNEERELLRLSTAGSVDDGKSTLIGRLLVDSKGVYEDHIASIRKATVNQTAGALDFALLTDGLRAEREQGITIDVAYRYFATPKRKFIIADTPGHEQYTRNMATGASTANLAIILIDARNGVLQQSRRHAFIAALLGIPHIVVCINKMDLVDFREEIFESIRTEFSTFATALGIRDLHFIPISALQGDNVVDRSRNMPWFEGGSLLHYLETVHIASDRNFKDLRFPVQYVIRPNLDFRGFAGQIASGTVRPGDAIMVLPSGRTSKVASIVTYDGNLDQAVPPMSVTLCLEDEIDVSRGDMLVHPTDCPNVSRRFDAMCVWMNQTPLEENKPYLLKHTTNTVKAQVKKVHYRVDINTLAHVDASGLHMNEIGHISVEALRPVFFDVYDQNRSTGAFILIDPLTNETLCAGMIRGLQARDAQRPARVLDGLELDIGRVTLAEKIARAGHLPFTIWLSGNVEVAYSLERRLFDRGSQVHVLAGESNPDLLPEAARILNAAGVIAICSLPTSDPLAIEHARRVIGDERFVIVGNPEGNPQEAANDICRTLETKGLLRARQYFDSGEGI